MLQSQSFIGNIEQASNGQEALDKVIYLERNSKPEELLDIIFLDLNMPIMDGYEACSKIKEFYKSSDTLRVQSYSETLKEKD